MTYTKRQIQGFMKDEHQASQGYRKLAFQHNDEELMKIANDEERHFEFWRREMKKLEGD